MTNDLFEFLEEHRETLQEWWPDPMTERDVARIEAGTYCIEQAVGRDLHRQDKAVGELVELLRTYGWSILSRALVEAIRRA